jgi:hypothetical protein
MEGFLIMVYPLVNSDWSFRMTTMTADLTLGIQQLGWKNGKRMRVLLRGLPNLLKHLTIMVG